MADRALRLTIVANEVPFPPVHGGHADVWKRIVALKNQGVHIQLIAWRDGADITGGNVQGRLLESVDSFVEMEKSQTVCGKAVRLLRTLRYPSQVAARHVSSSRFVEVRDQVKAFDPDVVMVDGLFGWLLGKRVAHDLQVPVVCRSHNIEHVYIATLLEKATTFKSKVSFFLAGAHLRKFEMLALKQSARFYDISYQDLQRWHAMGVINGEWLPPVVEKRQFHSLDNKSFDIGFLGNLYTPNNVEGVLWFLDKVVPLLPEGRSVAIAGSKPCDQIRAVCRNSPNISLIENPERVEDVYAACKVMINPVLGGSGVNMKIIEMLQTELPIVSTLQGVAGLPSDVTCQVRVASTEREFADWIESSIESPAVACNERENVLDLYFGSKAIGRFVDSLLEVTSSNTVSRA
jgi:polysaccharide biosynthesis protein PslH